MKREPILLVGAGGHARSCIDVVEQEGRFEIAGLLGLADEVGSKVLGYPVIGSDADSLALLRKHGCALVTVGQIKSPDVRIRLFEVVLASGVVSPTIVSPTAYVSPHARIGPGTIVMHGAVVNAGAVVGRNCILNSQSLVEHDAIIADHCHISTGAVINGGAGIGEGSFVGSNSVVRELVNVGARSVIGMGKSIVVDCEPGTHIPFSKALA